MPKSDLPFGSEFSPSQIELPRILELAEEHGGDWRAFEIAVRAAYFEYHRTDDDNKKKLANNAKLGMIAYGIIDRDARLTELGEQLFALRHDEASLYEALARHILLHLHGMALVRCIQEMTAAGEVVNLTTLREALALRGVYFPSGGKHPSIMRLWLAKAGVFAGERWQVSEERLQALLGVRSNDFGQLAYFTPEQRAFLRALANTGVDTPQPANAVAKLAAATYGVKFPEKSLPKAVLHDLEAAGYLVATKTTGGRGAKPFWVTPTAKLRAEVVEPLLLQLADESDPQLLDWLKMSLAEILTDVHAEDRHIAGLALEALAFKRRGQIGNEARRYANKVMADSHLAIVMVDGRDLSLIVTTPSAIADLFQREARHAMQLKSLDL